MLSAFLLQQVASRDEGKEEEMEIIGSPTWAVLNRF